MEEALPNHLGNRRYKLEGKSVLLGSFSQFPHLPEDGMLLIDTVEYQHVDKVFSKSDRLSYTGKLKLGSRGSSGSASGSSQICLHKLRLPLYP